MSSGIVEWNERLSVGVAEFDAAHRQLIAVIDKLFSAYRAGTLAGQVQPILGELITYADEHFEHEEDCKRPSDHTLMQSGGCA